MLTKVQLIHTIMLAFAVGTASLTITKARICRGLRKLIHNKSTLAGELFSCPYCMCHWIAAVAVLLKAPEGLRLFLLPFYWLILTGMSAMIAGILYKLYGGYDDET